MNIIGFEIFHFYTITKRIIMNEERDELNSPSGYLFRMFNEIEANKVEGTPIEDCVACAGEGDMLIGENEWETCLNCGGLGYAKIENVELTRAVFRVAVQRFVLL